ncbi:transmembrane protein, putative (macronuclear) [Tetrahymena thermophila SB210]|uniref:Transmembrane protein, putative n=1 Tax=Tetrahymena thermophila (strain SB210) TaxID=312017 RepID=I7M1V5_TETTS|nr:transmembrane protein, putative [Tetrahymena thermophila SB210]EAR97857.2 transmembrane protein, putative [Tetrahymena thermophila SB210]|eukprot:XP_001018102.2 transmembrane protein, putative [Tetrahymena thermophila SB210]
MQQQQIKLNLAFQLGFILFVRALQVNCIWWLIYQQIYQNVLWMSYVLIYFLIGATVTFKYYVQRLNVQKLELIFVPILQILFIEDIYYLIRFDKFSQYFKGDDNDGWFIRYIIMICSFIPQIIPMLIMLDLNKKECLFIVLPIISIVYLCYLAQNYIVIKEVEIFKIQMLISYPRVLITSIQSFTFSGISFQLGQTLEIRYIWFTILILGYILILVQIVRICYRAESKTLAIYQMLITIKLIFGVNVDNQNVYISKLATRIRTYLIDMDNECLVYFSFTSIAQLILFIIQKNNNNESLSSVVVIPWLIVLFLSVIMYTYNFSKNIVYDNLFGKETICITSFKQLRRCLSLQNSQNFQKTKVILLNIKKNKSKIHLAIQNCLLSEFKGCQIIDINNKFKRKDLVANLFQQVRLNYEFKFNLEEFEKHLNENKIVKEIIKIKFNQIDDKTYIRLVNLLLQKNLIIKIECKNSYFESQRRNQIKIIHQNYLNLYYNVTLNNQIAFYKYYAEFIPLNPALVIYDLLCE